MIAAGDMAWPRRSVGKLDRDLAFFRQRLVGGHDEPGLPDEARRARPMRVHRNDRRSRPGDDACNRRRERGKEARQRDRSCGGENSGWASSNLGTPMALRNYPDGQDDALRTNFPCPPRKWPFPHNIFPVSSDGKFLEMRCIAAVFPVVRLEGYRDDRFSQG